MYVCSQTYAYLASVSNHRTLFMLGFCYDELEIIIRKYRRITSRDQELNLMSIYCTQTLQSFSEMRERYL